VFSDARIISHDRNPPCDPEVVVQGDDFAQVLAAARLGEEWALVSLYRDVHPALLRYLRSGAGVDGEDLASDVWIEVARSLPRFEGDAAGFRRFVFTIARRRAIDHGRKRGRRRTEPMDMASTETLADEADVEAATIDTMDSAEAVERIRALLPPDQADVILLRVIVGLSVAEVAEIMGKRPGTISVLQHRALRRLASRLGDDGTS
jgi:RNA polymerase sigma-70 factor, ECF subfamily